MASTTTKIVEYNKIEQSYSIVENFTGKHTLDTGAFFADASGGAPTPSPGYGNISDPFIISTKYDQCNGETGFTLLKGCKIIINEKVYSIYEKDKKLAYGISDTFYITITKTDKDYTTTIN